MKNLLTLISILFFNFLYSQEVITNIIKDGDGYIDKIEYYKKYNNKLELFRIEEYFENGHIEIPKGPGLGVEFDPKFLEKHLVG